ncbi:hypothetical protein M9M37_001838 [Escherichia coli]|uniref:hypothetical protein n=1 Tax=Escherichia coli TaxID=562 RepID=UPI0010F1FC5B|nr:hypothetical protein [Escherichia coli]EJF8031375.1 hypothetical protein [Escherichia coli]MDF1396562.1 hypothetical protein [Escherichia coli]GDF32077.1 hypothetical protein HmCmsJML270_00765 [Escherichia coli]HAL6342328.1 hypothetical protein [Escherichia coli]HAX4872303.1 hypothetical protein [Escherichia coli]
MSKINYQALRAAAEEEIMCRQACDTSDNWQDLVTPEAVIALVDELAATKRRVTVLEGMNAASAKYAKKMADSRDKLRNRVSELNSYHTAYIDWQEKTDWVQADTTRFKSILPLGKHRADVLREYIEYLESRVVTVTLPEYRNSPDMHTKEYYETIGFNQGLDACIGALRAAGVAVEGDTNANNN